MRDRTQVTTSADGTVRTVVNDPYGNPVSDNTIQKNDGAQTLAQSLNTVNDALSMIRAIQTGNPLPATVSGLHFASDLNQGNTNLAGSADVGSGILSLMSLNSDLKNGDTLGAVYSGMQTVQYAAEAYANFAGSALSESAQVAAPIASELASGIGEALPYVGLIAAIASGDTTSIALAVVSLIPVLGEVVAIFEVIAAIFGGGDGPPPPWGTGSYVWNGNAVSVTSSGESGGGEVVSGFMNSVLSTMNTIIAQEQQQNPGEKLGIIPNRMPTLGVWHGWIPVH